MIRKILIPKNRELLLHLPEEFVGQEIEVIAFTVESKEKPDKPNAEKRLAQLKAFIGKNTIKLPKGYKFNREDLYE